MAQKARRRITLFAAIVSQPTPPPLPRIPLLPTGPFPTDLVPARVVRVVTLDELEHHDGALGEQVRVLRLLLRYALKLLPGELARDETNPEGRSRAVSGAAL